MEQLLSQQIQAIRQRLQVLYQSAHSDSVQPDLLPKAFDELDHALEELQALETELYQQQARLLDTQQHLEAERQPYQELFEFAPAGYLITNPQGTIRRANRTATALFETVEKLMIGRSLATFVPEGERRAFRAAMAGLPAVEGTQEWEAHMQPSAGPAFDAALSVAVVRGQLGCPVALRWIIKKTSWSKRAAERRDSHTTVPKQAVHSGKVKEFGG
jgi:PAS domain S-box-containing protein